MFNLSKNENAGTNLESADEVPNSASTAEPQVLIYLSSEHEFCVNKSHDLLGEAIQDHFGDHEIRSILYFEDFTRSERQYIMYRHNIPHGTRFARIALVNPGNVYLAMRDTERKAVTCMCCIGADGVLPVVGPDQGHGFRIHALKYRNRRSVNPKTKSTVSQKLTRRLSLRTCASSGVKRLSKRSQTLSTQSYISEGTMSMSGSACRSPSGRKSRVDAYNNCMINAFPHTYFKVKGAWCTIDIPQNKDIDLKDDRSFSPDSLNLGSTIEEDTML